MLLSLEDVGLLVRAGYSREEFVVEDARGYLVLRNVGGRCFFYDAEGRRCRVYRLRPEGCTLYPVIFSEGEGVIVDELCPERRGVKKSEIDSKGKRVVELLRRIDGEAAARRGK